MMQSILTRAFALAAIALATPAHAVFIEYEFQGTIQNDPSDSIRVRGDGGGFVPYSGESVPFPYEIGEMITFAFQAFLPIGGQRPPADGIYRFGPKLTSSDTGADTGMTIFRSDGSVDGDFRNAFGLNDFGYSFVYDSNPGVPDSQRLRLDISGGRRVQDTIFSPDYEFDPNSGNIVRGRGGRCDESDREGCASLSISEFDATISGTSVIQFGPVIPGEPRSGQPFLEGIFSDPVRLSGQWSIPVISDNDPVDVPTPPVLLLFGISAGALVWRRKQKLRAKI